MLHALEIRAGLSSVTVEVVDDPACAALMARFIAERPELWNEDIGV